MSDARRLVAILVAVMGLGIAVFGIVRGLSATGPARGVRMIISLEPPVDAAAIALAQQVVKDRIDERSARVLPAGDKLVLELSETENVAATVEILERTAKLQVRAAGEPIDVRTLRGAEVSRGGVAIEMTDTRRIEPGMSLEFELDGKVRGTHAVDATTATNVHVVLADARAASELVASIQAGAVRPLHVVKQEPFTRTTGFLPRAWLFLAIGGLLIVIGAVLGRRR